MYANSAEGEEEKKYMYNVRTKKTASSIISKYREYLISLPIFITTSDTSSCLIIFMYTKKRTYKNILTKICTFGKVNFTKRE
jgi:hypothetical protein